LNVALALVWVSGIIIEVDALRVAKAVWKLGAGRSKADEGVDLKVGIRLLHVEGEKVKIGEGLMEVHHSSSELPADIRKQLEEAIVISENGDETVQSLIIDIITV
jgi:thymidine phosphorylase